MPDSRSRPSDPLSERGTPPSPRARSAARELPVVARRCLAARVRDLDLLKDDRDLIDPPCAFGRVLVKCALEIRNGRVRQLDRLEDLFLAGLVGANELKEHRLQNLVGYRGLEQLRRSRPPLLREGDGRVDPLPARLAGRDIARTRDLRTERQPFDLALGVRERRLALESALPAAFDRDVEHACHGGLLCGDDTNTSSTRPPKNLRT